jgi:hypothetical protein
MDSILSPSRIWLVYTKYDYGILSWCNSKYRSIIYSNMVELLCKRETVRLGRRSSPVEAVVAKAQQLSSHRGHEEQRWPAKDLCRQRSAAVVGSAGRCCSADGVGCSSSRGAASTA